MNDTASVSNDASSAHSTTSMAHNSHNGLRATSGGVRRKTKRPDAGAVEEVPFIGDPRALCIQALLNETKEKLAILSHVKTTRKNNGNNNSDNLIQVIEERKFIEQGFAEHLANNREGRSRQANLPISGEGSGPSPTDDATKELVDRFRNLRQDLDSNMKSDLDSSALTAHVRREKNRLLEMLEQTDHELLLKSDCPTLRNTVEEQLSAEEQCQELTASIKLLSQQVSDLATTINVERSKAETEELALRKHTTALKEEVSIVREETTEKTHLTKATTEAAFNTTQRLRGLEQTGLTEQLEELELRLSREKKAFSHTKQFLLRKIAATESELGRWNEKYETDVHQLTSELEALSQQRESVLNDLKAIEDEYKDESSRKADRDKFEADLAYLNSMKDKGAVLIQAWWRGYTARKQYVKMKKGKKKGKGKGKKKKK